MRRLHTDNLVQSVRTVFRVIDDQAIDQVLNQGIGGGGVRETGKVLRGFELQHWGGSSGISPGIKKPARGGFDEGGLGVIGFSSFIQT